MKNNTPNNIIIGDYVIYFWDSTPDIKCIGIYDSKLEYKHYSEYDTRIQVITSNQHIRIDTIIVRKKDLIKIPNTYGLLDLLC